MTTPAAPAPASDGPAGPSTPGGGAASDLPGRITLVGTGHVFDIGARVREEIRKRAPSAVAIELDGPRYHALRNRGKQERRNAPFFYRLMADFQTRIANEYGVEAGDEMLAAADEARELAIPIALIDADAQHTFQRLLREMRFGEKVRLAGTALLSVLPLPGKSIEKQVDEMQDDYASYFEAMGKKFPTLKRILLDERNVHMARNLSRMAQVQERVVAVVGDGHVDGMRDILVAEGLRVETVRLRDLRAAAKPPEGTASASLSLEVPSTPPPPRGPPP